MEKVIKLEKSIKELQSKIAEKLDVKWRFAQGVKNGESTDIDDSSWEERQGSSISWVMKDGIAYLRTLFTVPDSIEGIGVKGSDIDISFIFPSGVTMFIDGKEVYSYKFWADMRAHPYPLVKNAVPGEKHLIIFKTTEGDGLGTFWGNIRISNIEDILFELNSITYQLKFAFAISRRVKHLDRYAEEALDILEPDDITHRRWEKILAAIKKAEDVLSPFRKEAKKFTVHLIGHAHIDMNWLWTYEDTINICLRDFETVTKLMEKYPDLTFSQSQAHIYKIVEEHNPELFEKVKKRADEGRWDITASSWVEGDLNMVNGESILRHILYSSKYISERLGKKTEIFWSPDTFGHPETIPSILASAGIKYYYFMRCGKGLPLMRWKGKDKSELIAFNSIYNNSISPETLMPPFIEYYERYRLPHFLFVYGVGDHGGGPTEADIKRKQKMEERPVCPKLVFSTTHRYFKAVERYKNRIPVITGELNTIFEGCYTTHSDIKKYNREGENLLLSIETLSALTHIITGKAVPEKEIEELWQKVLFNQFHDILDGSAIHSSYEYSAKIAEEVRTKGEKLLNQYAEPLISSKESDKFMVFNPLGWHRKSIINEKLIADIPGYGYKTVDIGKKQETGRITETGSEYENEFYRIAIDETKGLIRKLYDKKSRREVLFPATPISEDLSSWWAEKRSNLISVYWEEPHPMSAWVIGNIYRIENLLKADEIKKEAYHLKTIFYIKRTYRSSEILQKIILYNQLPFIDFENEINWNEEGNHKEGVPMLRVNFHTALKNPETCFEVPFGMVKRDVSGKEYPALRWAGQRQGRYWVVLMNKEKYGYNIDGNNLSLTLLRNAYEPDALSDKGRHIISFRLFFGMSRTSDITKMAMEYNIPPIVISGEAEPQEFCPFTIKGDIVPTCFKKALDRDTYILRLVEIEGKKTSVQLEFTSTPQKVYITNSVEKREKQIKKIRGKQIILNISPFQILTLDMRF
ncbi:MAG: glycoside hydrolase family 38 C-terminal domain-containing protein [Candidatus Ratteibacteria bacterium]|nr:glycoside hydrolase family 38 C-terminal domain-containing protein [Candidatus Ratteibacteria bacterium]